jgi:hypothetical protein
MLSKPRGFAIETDGNDPLLGHRAHESVAQRWGGGADYQSNVQTFNNITWTDRRVEGQEGQVKVHGWGLSSRVEWVVGGWVGGWVCKS